MILASALLYLVSGATVASASEEALAALVAAERELLRQALVDYRVLTTRRDENARRLAEVHHTLDLEVTGGAPDPARLDTLTARLLAEERTRTELFGQIRSAVDGVRHAVRRVRVLEAGLGDASRDRASDPRDDGLTGSWRFRIDGGEPGSVELVQEGTSLLGTYRLDGGFTGNLEGTRIGSRIRLVRIDARLGKTAELEGKIIDGGGEIRGTWQSFELAGAEPAAGTFRLTRQDRRGDP